MERKDGIRSEKGCKQIKPLLILDVDTGFDDAVAIMLALQSTKNNKFILQGITTVSGNVPVNRTYINTVAVCNELSENSNVKVYSGCSKPLVRKPHYAFCVHGESGLEGVTFSNKVETTLETTLSKKNLPDAVSFILESVNTFPSKISIIATGPLTNIATAIQTDLSVVDKIQQIVLMGGGIEHGNITPNAEFNIFCDPEAADIVFSSSIPITMIPLDTTLKMEVTENIISRIYKVNNNAASLCGDTLSCYVKKYKKHCGKLPAAHDVSTIMYILNPELFTSQKAFIKVITDNSDLAGKTVITFSSSENTHDITNAREICVVTDVDVDSFWTSFIQYLK